jgi:branched-chain amino acid transport system ATP-binding protein
MALIECRNLERRFGALAAVADVSMDVEQREIRAVIGPNGAGKSTLFNLITGLLRPTAGNVYFKGENLTGLAAHRICQRGLSRTFQITSIFPILAVIENVRLGAQARTSARWRLLRGGSAIERSREQAAAWLDRIGLASFADRPAQQLSHGDQRLLEIVMALAQSPAVLLLDEPTQGLAVDETQRTVNLLKALIAESGVTVLLVEHDMEVVFSLAQRITVLDRGRVIADGLPNAVRSDAAVQKAYLGGLE